MRAGLFRTVQSSGASVIYSACLLLGCSSDRGPTTIIIDPGSTGATSAVGTSGVGNGSGAGRVGEGGMGTGSGGAAPGSAGRLGSGATAGSSGQGGPLAGAAGQGGEEQPKLGQMMADCGAAEGGAPTKKIEAECALGTGCNGLTASQSGVQAESGGTTVGYIEPGDWLRFEGITLDGYKTLKVNYAKGEAGGSLEVRLDSPTGTRIGSLSPATTGSWSTWSEGTIALTASTGPHAVYVVAAGTGTGGVFNLDWIELSSGATAATGAASAIHINQLGYEALGPKHVVVEGNGSLTRFQVVKSGGQSVWCGDLQPVQFTEWGGTTYYSVDFSGLTAPGIYTVSVGGKVSDEFEIAEDRLFKKTFATVLSYFKKSRADDADVVAKDSAVPIINGGTVDAHGGWYDASGDISKYLTHLSYANFLNPQQIPLVAWGLAYARDEGGEALTAANLQAGVQEEALWGADYLLRVLSPEGYFYTNVFDSWSGSIEARQICAFEGTGSPTITADYQAAFREGGGLSIAALARIGGWGVDGAFTSAQYLAGAEKAFEHLQLNNVKYANDGKENVIDDYAALLAASELFAATKKASYLEAARVRATSLAARLHSSGYFIADGAARPFWHASDAGLPVVALARYVEVETDAGPKEAATKAIATHLDYLVTVTQAVANPFGYARQNFAGGSGFFIPHTNESDYWWQGENARLASLSAAALIGGRKLQSGGVLMAGVKGDYARFAGQQLDWILGKNPFDVCFLNGYGKNNPPKYSGDKPQNGTLPGGISNGITGKESDGSGIQWQWAGDPTTEWENWRWVEQWLPHSAWYMIAITAMAK